MSTQIKPHVHLSDGNCDCYYDKQPSGPCPHCGELKYVGMVTCGKSECQEASYRENVVRNKPKSKRRT